MPLTPPDATIVVLTGAGISKESGHVYPAAGFVEQVRRRGRAHTIELNLEPSEGASLFHEARAGRASDLVPAFVDELMHRHDA